MVMCVHYFMHMIYKYAYATFEKWIYFIHDSIYRTWTYSIFLTTHLLLKTQSVLETRFGLESAAFATELKSQCMIALKF